MSDSGLDILGSEPGDRRATRPGGRRAPRRGPRWGRIILVLALVGGIVFGGKVVWDKAGTYLNGPQDYTGRGSGEVVVEIPSGADGQAMARILAKQDVVKTAEAFYQLSLNDDRFSTIQPGFYQLRRKMSAAAALDGLTDTSNRVEGRVVIPEGSRVGQIVKAIAAGSEIPEADVTKVLDDPSELGLPAEANGNPEGYLYPATYTVEPGTTALELLRQMVKKTLDVENDLDIDTRARALGLSKEDVLTVASILEYEAARDEDYPKVARVLYNRIADGMPLQLDSTVSYVSKREGDVWTTPEERANPSEYNTYQNTGLPPGPIGSPGEKTIEAALNPAQGDWLYFFADKQGVTIFNTSFAKHTADCQKVYGAGSCGG
ncbi:MAG: endolytic transglycosylase MltG [Aeromicrobium erythreum]